MDEISVDIGGPNKRNVHIVPPPADSEAARSTAPYVPAGEDSAEMAAWTGVARGLLNLDEFLVRE